MPLPGKVGEGLAEVAVGEGSGTDGAVGRVGVDGDLTGRGAGAGVRRDVAGGGDRGAMDDGQRTGVVAGGAEGERGGGGAIGDGRPLLHQILHVDAAEAGGEVVAYGAGIAAQHRTAGPVPLQLAVPLAQGIWLLSVVMSLKTQAAAGGPLAAQAVPALLLGGGERVEGVVHVALAGGGRRRRVGLIGLIDQGEHAGEGCGGEGGAAGADEVGARGAERAGGVRGSRRRPAGRRSRARRRRRRPRRARRREDHAPRRWRFRSHRSARRAWGTPAQEAPLPVAQLLAPPEPPRTIGPMACGPRLSFQAVSMR